jgi:hypothetical protein
MGDVAVLSFGPGKRIDAGEAGVLLARDPRVHRRALAACAHPLRAAVLGFDIDPGALTIRPHPLAAILALDALARWDASADERANRALAARLATDPALTVLGYDDRRTNAGRTVPVLTTGAEPAAMGRTGAMVLPGARDRERLTDFAHRVRMVPVEHPRTEAARHVE